MQKLGDSINELLGQTGLKREINEQKLIQSWEKNLGKVVANHTLSVKISSPRPSLRDT